MNREMEKLLSTCLDQFEQGESIEAIVSRYPQQAEQIRPFLETAGRLSQLSSLPTVAARQASQSRFLAEAASLGTATPAAPPAIPLFRRLLAPLAAFAVLIFLVGVTLFTASANALPGDAIYPLKLTIENVRLMQASDPQQILNLAEQFRQERRDEITMLLLEGRRADVAFEGQIEMIDPSRWVVSGLVVQIDDQTIIEGTARVGETARIEGYTSEGTLFGRTISVITGRPDPDETPEPIVTPTRMDEQEIVATPTPAQPTPSSTPVVTPSETPAAIVPDQSPPPLPTAPAPTAVPTDEGTADDGNENDADDDREDNDNGDDDLADNDNDQDGDDNNNNSDDNNGNGDDDNNDNDDNDANDNGDDDANENDDNDANDNGDDDDDDDNDDEGANNDNDDGDDDNDDNVDEGNNDNGDGDGDNDDDEDDGNDDNGDDDNNNDNDDDDDNDNDDDEDDDNGEDDDDDDDE